MTADGLETKGQGACWRNSHLEFFIAKSVNQKRMSDLVLSKMVTKSVEVNKSGKPLFQREFFDRFLGGGAGMEEDAILSASEKEERQKRRAERSEDCHFKRFANNLMSTAKSR